jgi:hypothetical protein
VQGGQPEPIVSFEIFKEVLITRISAPTIVDLTMLDGDDDVETMKVLILDESNPYKGSSLSVEPQPKGMPLATNVVDKVIAPEEQGSQPSKEEKTQESEGGNKNEEQSSNYTTLITYLATHRLGSLLQNSLLN